MDKTFVQILTGCDMDERTAIKDAVTARAIKLIPTLTQRTGSYCYDGNRTRPENLGWRFLQNVQGSHYPVVAGGCVGPRELYGKKIAVPTVELIECGDYDWVIEATFHEAAGAEHWYLYEKQW